MPVVTRRLTITRKSNTKGGHKYKQTPASPLKQFENKICGGRGWNWFCSISRLLAMLLRYSAAARIYHSMIIQFPAALVDFLNVNPSVAGTNGGLAAELTVDGLHLNREGYRRLARVIAAQLVSITQLP